MNSRCLLGTFHLHVSFVELYERSPVALYTRRLSKSAYIPGIRAGMSYMRGPTTHLDEFLLRILLVVLVTIWMPFQGLESIMRGH